MVATALGLMRWQRPFAHPFARWLGDISYGMYLIHAVIAFYAFRLLFTHPTAPPIRGDGSFGTFVALAALVLPLTVLYGYVSGRYLEQPISGFRRVVVTPDDVKSAPTGAVRCNPLAIGRRGVGLS
jgi:peptidoglycan/LPS O-acetylase OafA/YrhL